MKHLFTLIALGSVALVSADQYGNGYSSCPSCQRGGGGYYQDQNNNGGYNQQNWDNQRQNQPGNYSGNNNQRDYRNNQPSQQNQSYNQNPQNNQQNWRDQSYDQNSQYAQQRNGPNDRGMQYDRDQQRYSDNNNGYQRNNNNQANVSDQDLNQKIRDALSSGWFSKGFQNVSADVNNGNVNLRGSVDTLDNKNKVEERVRKIDGVRQVNNQITVAKENGDNNNYSDEELRKSEEKFPQDYAASNQDRQLNAKIRDKLNNGWFSKGYDALILKTTNGFVVITGSVDNSDDVKKINDQLKDIEGVRSVDNQVNVKNMNR